MLSNSPSADADDSKRRRLGRRRLREAVAVELQEQRVDASLALRVVLNFVHGEVFAHGVPLFHQEYLKLSEKFGLSAHILRIKPGSKDFCGGGHEAM